MSDGAANPYLVAAAVLHAARFGVEQQMAPPEPQVAGRAAEHRPPVPPTLEAALEALEADEELCAALGPWVVETFTKLKRAEWERYAKTVGDPATTEVTPWETRVLPAVLLRGGPSFDEDWMAMSVRLDEIDLSSHDAFVEEVPTLGVPELRERDPVHWQAEPTPNRGFWAVTRFHDIEEILRDTKRFSSARGVTLEEQTEEEVEARASMIDMDPPKHSRLRRLV